MKKWKPARLGCCIVLLAVALGAPLAHADTLSGSARIEIGLLLSKLETSGCRFSRNGTWYSAEAARAHLDRKLQYLVNRGAVASAEQFIERAASKSSMSGQRYWVQCDGQSPVQSNTWLHGELKGLRTQSVAPEIKHRPDIRND